jgi:nucleoside-diphosphate-sugar epimerase
MNYGTGMSGFLGKCLDSRIEVKAIPHQEIGAVKLTDVDNFYFLSSYGNMAHHFNDEMVAKANIGDLITVTSAIKWGDIQSFIFISTSSVKRRIQTFYSRTKKAAEELLLAYMEKYNAPISILRPLSITGVGEQDKHLIPTLIRSCLYGEEMPFVAEPTHDYIDVTDVVSAITRLSSMRVRGIYEAGTGRSYTNQQVKDIVEEVTGKKANVSLVSNMRSYDGGEWVSTNFRLRQLGWEPKKDLHQIVEEMVHEEQSRKDNS